MSSYRTYPTVRTVLSRGTLAVALASSALLCGCASLNPQGGIYTAAQTQLPESVTMARVERVRPVEIDGGTQASSLVGEIGGGLLGAVAGSAIGAGHGSLLAGIAGGLAGGFAGHEIENGVERKLGLEITVRMPDGRLQAITQPASEGEFYPGEPVRLLAAEDGTTHVTY